MLLGNAIIVIVSAGILGVGLIFAIRIIRILRNYGQARPWIVLSILISFFSLGYIFTALRFLNINLMPGATLDGLVTAIFFFGAVFVLILAVLNRNLFANIFGTTINDSKAIDLFADYVGMPVMNLAALIRPAYSVTCDICQQRVKYSIPDIVRTHPRLDRGVEIEKTTGEVIYKFYVRHYCNREYREMPVRHDHKFEYLSTGSSRLV